MNMMMLGTDAHKASHTVVATDANGVQRATRTFGTTTTDHLEMVRWAAQWPERSWAVEDARQLSRRLEQDLLAAGERVIRVPPVLMANARASSRQPGKSDPIDALAIARAALREPGLPTAQLDGPEREVRLLTDHREDLVAERTRDINRLRWHLHELDPSFIPPAGSIDRYVILDQIFDHLAGFEGTVARIARRLAERIRQMTIEIKALTKELKELTAKTAETLLELHGCGPIMASVLIGQVADVTRFKSKDAFARHNGTAPVPAMSGNSNRHRLSRHGNRRINYAIHHIALTQSIAYPPARAYLAKRKANGDSHREAIRALKRHISDAVFAAMKTDAARKQLT
jgi:transposase